MSTILGHGLGGALAAAIVTTKLTRDKQQRIVVAAALAGVIPDLDVLVYLLLSPEGMTVHRSISHSLIFGLATAAVVLICAVRFIPAPLGTVFLALSLACLSHPVLDFLMGAGPPIGFFSPFSDHAYLFPIVAVPVAYYATSLSGLVLLLIHPPTVLAILLEIAILLPLLSLAMRYRRLSRACLWAIAGSAELFTLVFYNLM